MNMSSREAELHRAGERMMQQRDQAREEAAGHTARYTEVQEANNYLTEVVAKLIGQLEAEIVRKSQAREEAEGLREALHGRNDKIVELAEVLAVRDSRDEAMIVAITAGIDAIIAALKDPVPHSEAENPE